MMGSYACELVTPITVWVVSKNESNCLLENKMIHCIYINLEACQITVVCLLIFISHQFNSAMSATFQFTKK